MKRLAVSKFWIQLLRDIQMKNVMHILKITSMQQRIVMSDISKEKITDTRISWNGVYQGIACWV